MRFEDIKRDQGGRCSKLSVGEGSDQGQLPMGGSKDSKPTMQSDAAGPRELVQEHSKESGFARNDSSLGQYALYGQVCRLRCAVAVLDLRALCGAPLRTDLHESANEAWRGTWHDLAAAYCARSSREPSARALERSAAMADKATRRRAFLLGG